MSSDVKEVEWSSIKSTIWWVIGVSAAVWFGASVAYWVLPEKTPISGAILGTFGDFLGGTLNPILSLLSVVGLAAAVILQRNQVILAKNEAAEAARLAKEQLDQSKAEATESKKVAQRQIFDSAFFPMLSLHHEMITQIKYDNTRYTDSFGNSFASKPRDGRAAFESFYDDIKSLIKRRKAHSNRPADRQLQEIVSAYKDFYMIHGSFVGNYFRHLYRIYKLIDKAQFDTDPGINTEIKRSYSGIVRAQLSSFELLALFYNGLSEYGENFKDLIERYAVLEHMPIDVLVDNHNDLVLYKREAYGKDKMAKERYSKVMGESPHFL